MRQPSSPRLRDVATEARLRLEAYVARLEQSDPSPAVRQCISSSRAAERVVAAPGAVTSCAAEQSNSFTTANASSGGESHARVAACSISNTPSHARRERPRPTAQPLLSSVRSTPLPADDRRSAISASPHRRDGGGRSNQPTPRQAARRRVLEEMEPTLQLTSQLQPPPRTPKPLRRPSLLVAPLPVPTPAAACTSVTTPPAALTPHTPASSAMALKRKAADAVAVAEAAAQQAAQAAEAAMRAALAAASAAAHNSENKHGTRALLLRSEPPSGVPHVAHASSDTVATPSTVASVPRTDVTRPTASSGAKAPPRSRAIHRGSRTAVEVSPPPVDWKRLRSQAAVTMQRHARGCRARSLCSDAREYQALVAKLRGWRQKVDAIILVQAWARGVRDRQLRIVKTAAIRRLQAGARGAFDRTIARRLRERRQAKEAVRARKEAARLLTERLSAHKERPPPHNPSSCSDSRRSSASSVASDGPSQLGTGSRLDSRRSSASSTTGGGADGTRQSVRLEIHACSRQASSPRAGSPQSTAASIFNRLRSDDYLTSRQLLARSTAGTARNANAPGSSTTTEAGPYHAISAPPVPAPVMPGTVAAASLAARVAAVSSGERDLDTSLAASFASSEDSVAAKAAYESVVAVAQHSRASSNPHSRGGPVLPPPPTAAAKAAAAKRAAAAYQAHLDRTSPRPSPRGNRPSPRSRCERSTHPHNKDCVDVAEDELPLERLATAFREPSNEASSGMILATARPVVPHDALQPCEGSVGWLGGMGDWLRNLFLGAASQETAQVDSAMPKSPQQASCDVSMCANIDVKAMHADRCQNHQVHAASTMPRTRRERASNSSLFERSTASQLSKRAAANSTGSCRSQPNSASGDTGGSNGQRRLAVAATADGSFLPSGRIMQLTTSFGARVLATRQVQESMQQVQEAQMSGVPISTDPRVEPVLAIDKEGVMWRWVESYGWRKNGEEADGEEEARAATSARNRPARSAEQIAASLESRRRLYGLSQPPVRANVEQSSRSKRRKSDTRVEPQTISANALTKQVASTKCAQRHAPEFHASVKPHDEASDEVINLEATEHAKQVSQPRDATALPSPDETPLMTAAAGGDNRARPKPADVQDSQDGCAVHMNSARRALHFPSSSPTARVSLQRTTQSCSERPSYAAATAASSADSTREASPAHAECVSHARRLSAAESAASAARMYAAGGRKSFHALKERAIVKRAQAIVSALIQATWLKPCDISLISRTLGRADYAMLRVICILFAHDSGESLSYALLRLGDCDAKTILRGVVEAVEHGDGDRPADESLAAEQAAYLHRSAADEGALCAAATHVFSDLSDEQMLALKAAFRAQHKATLESLFHRVLAGPVHSQMRDLLLSRCGVVRSRPAVVDALTELVSDGAAALLAAASLGEGGVDELEGMPGARANDARTAALHLAPPQPSRLPQLSSHDTVGYACAPTTPGLMVLQQTQGKVRRIPGGYAGDVDSASLTQVRTSSTPDLRQIPATRCSSCSDAMRPRSPGQANSHFASVGLPGSAPRKERLAQERMNLSEDISAASRSSNAAHTPRVLHGNAVIRAQAAKTLQRAYRIHRRCVKSWNRPWQADLHVAVSHSSIVERRREAAALCIQATARRVMARRQLLRTWIALLTIQALIRGWLARREVGLMLQQGPPRLGRPIVHPMTRLTHPMKGYYQGTSSSFVKGERGKARASGGRTINLQAPPRVTTPTVSSSKRGCQSGGSRFAREVSAAQLQMEAEHARHKQVRTILGASASQ